MSRRPIHFHAATSGARTRYYVTFRFGPWFSWTLRLA